MLIEERGMRGLTLLPAKAGTCAACATEHREGDPHNYWSLFYQMRFRLQQGREATHADAVAHLPVQAVDAYRRALRNFKQEWNEPADGKPIAEPYSKSGGLQQR